MTDILGESRSVVIGGRPELFHGYDALARRADELIGRMQRIETILGADPPGLDEEWHDLATAAEALVAVSIAQEVWLADHDAALNREIARVRDDIRSLNTGGGNASAGDIP